MNQDGKRLHLRSASILAPPSGSTEELPGQPATRPETPLYPRPDIVLLGSIRDAHEQIRQELKVIGEERSYSGALRVIVGRAKEIVRLAEALLVRHEKAGEE